MKVNTSRNILHMLGDRECISGETMATHLGLSRVAVWKQIQQLRERGYVIESSSRGYRLIKLPEEPRAEQFPPSFPFKVEYRQETGSTMEDARKAEERIATLFLAGKQNSGRGRKNRSWQSPEGGLYASVLFFPGSEYGAAFFSPMKLAASVVNVLRKTYHIPARISWPNDIVVGERKIAGIITELHGKYDLVDRQIIGIGINLQPVPGVPRSGALQEFVDRKKKLPSSADLAMGIFSEFHSRMNRWSPQQTIAAWKAASATIGRRVRIEKSWGTAVTGRAKDIGSDGSLLIESDEGYVEAVREGDCIMLSEQ